LRVFSVLKLVKREGVEVEVSVMRIQGKEIQMGLVPKSSMRKSFIINEEMRKYLPIYEGGRYLYDFATDPL
jgi:hypothetical protein